MEWVGVCTKGYQSPNLSFVCETKLGTMLPRRRRDKPIENTTMEEEMRRLLVRLDAWR
jgi:hypothetical protein